MDETEEIKINIEGFFKKLEIFESKKIAFFLYLLISVIFFHSFLENVTYWGTRDWASHMYQTELARNTYFNFKQFPLWDPYTSGGLTGPGDPLNYALSPHMILVFLFQILNIPYIVITFKITMIIYVALSAFGMWLIARYYNLHLIASYFAGFVYAFNSQIFLQMGEGTFWFKAITWVPYVVYFFLKSREQTKYVILSGLFLFMIFLETNTYHFAVALTFLGLWTLLEYIKNRNLKIFKNVMFVVILAFLIGAIRFIPVLEYSGLNPIVRVDTDSGYTFEKFKVALFDKVQEPYSHWFEGTQRGYYNLGMYIGVIPFLLFIAGVLLFWQKYFIEFNIFLIFLWLSFGNYTIIPLYRIWKLIPTFGYFHEAARFNIMLMMWGSLFVGLAINFIMRFNKIVINNQEVDIKKYLSISIGLLLLYSAFNMYNINTPVLEKIFIAPPISPQGEKATEFYQIQSVKKVNPWADGKLLPNLYHDGYGHGDYLRLQQNIGTINANYHSVISNSQVQPKIFADGNINPKYRGEFYLENGKGNVSLIAFTPNKMKFLVNANEDDIITLNQNYLNGWKVLVEGKTIKATELNRLVSHPVKKGATEVEFYYWPNSFFLGLFVSIITWICCIFYWFYGEIVEEKIKTIITFKKQD